MGSTGDVRKRVEASRAFKRVEASRAFVTHPPVSARTPSYSNQRASERESEGDRQRER